MKTVTIEKDRLKDKVGRNRDNHQQRYQEALAGWKKQVLEALRAAPEVFTETGSTEELNFGYKFPKPSSHVEEYDTALEMLDWETEDVIVLDEHSFRRLVLDDWEWTHQFLASSSRYHAT